MQITSAMKEAATESENKNKPGQSTNRSIIYKQFDGNDGFVTRDSHRVFLDDQGVLHACLKYATNGAGQGGSR